MPIRVNTIFDRGQPPRHIVNLPRPKITLPSAFLGINPFERLLCLNTLQQIIALNTTCCKVVSKTSELRLHHKKEHIRF